MKLIESTAGKINRIARNKGANYQQRLAAAYRPLLTLADQLLERSRQLQQQIVGSLTAHPKATKLRRRFGQLVKFCLMAQQVVNTAGRRVLNGETVPNIDKLFSVFEPETQLLKRGKAAKPIQFGHLLLVVEDAAGFVCDYRILPPGETDSSVLISAMTEFQQRLGGVIEHASFDRGFYSPANERDLAELITHPCLPRKGAKAGARQESQATVEFRQARQRHPGIESAIGALPSGNGQVRCRDHTYERYQRYAGLGVLGRNLHVLGKRLIAETHPKCEAAHSKRKAA